MLIIRQEQLHVFRMSRVDNFVNAMEAYLRSREPARFGVTSRSATLAFLRHAVTRAVLHGFTSERHCNLYVEMLLNLGASSGEEPEPLHVARILADRSIDAEERIWAALYEAAIAPLDHASPRDQTR